jgi:16S rRNA processing protein RimM
MLLRMARESAWTWWTPITKPEKLRVGRLLKAHGLKGAIKLELYTDSPETRFQKGAILQLQVPETSPWHGKTVTVSELRWYNQTPVLFLEGITDRTQAEILVHAILWSELSEFEISQESPDTWHDYVLVGMKVQMNGSELGRIVAVDHRPTQDLLVVAIAGQQVLIPFVKEIVPVVSVSEARVEITPPEGLLDLFI